ncbi:alpha/beta hydrolase [Candidatus Pantoea formicae]|uniref:alpha/beta hydrolase n=1 Tax=Candidatus Pantoea formicae TaxID=2608355 RepID=UPI003EDABA4A
MKFPRLFPLFVLLYLPAAFANKDIPIWPNEVSGNNKVVNFSKKPTINNRAVTKVDSPEMIYVPPAGKNNHSAVLIIPGGGFSYIMQDAEGLDVAKVLSQKGYSSFVLLYRMPRDGSEINRNNAFSDVQRAMRLIRGQATEYQIAANQIGVMGFSAGAFLAANVSNSPDANNYTAVDAQDKISARPDFTALIYPVLSLKNGVTHLGTRTAMYGKDISQQDIEQYSQEDRVTAKTPPTFLAQALDDGTASPKNTLQMFDALRQNHVKVEMHLFQQGGHGFGTGQKKNIPAKNWPTLFSDWQASLVPQTSSTH